jgi:hypothetical protein
MSAKDSKAMVRRYFEEVINQGNLNVIGGFGAPEFINHFPFHRTLPDLEGVKQGVELAWAVSLDM